VIVLLHPDPAYVFNKCITLHTPSLVLSTFILWFSLNLFLRKLRGWTD